MTQYRWPVEGKTYDEDDPKTYDPNVEFKGRNYVLKDGNLIPLAVAKSDHGLIEYTLPPDVVPQHNDLPSAFAAISTEAQTIADSLTQGVPDAEKLAWLAKEQEAREWIGDNNTSTPLIDDELAETGETKAELTAKIVGKADFYRSVVAHISGIRRKSEADLEAVTEQELMDDPFAYDKVLAASKALAMQRLGEVAAAHGVALL